MKILTIDPGDIVSGYVLMNNDYSIIEHGIIENSILLNKIYSFKEEELTIVIEHFESYGMAIGKTTIESIWWAGRFYEIAKEVGTAYRITRKVVKQNICGLTRAKDTNVIKALIDRFAKHDFKNGKGKKDNPDWFYGFTKDIWQSYALGVTYIDMIKGTTISNFYTYGEN